MKEKDKERKSSAIFFQEPIMMFYIRRMQDQPVILRWCSLVVLQCAYFYSLINISCLRPEIYYFYMKSGFLIIEISRVDILQRHTALQVRIGFCEYKQFPA